MRADGIQHLVERAYRESGEQQYIRELFVNARQAQAQRIEFGPEWQAAERLGVYRLCVADDGCGMAPDDMERFLNTFGGGGKPIGDAHENFGIGAKTSLLPWNHHGVVVISWTPSYPDGSMIRLRRDPTTGEYGATKTQSSDGEYRLVVSPYNDVDEGIDWQAVKPTWIHDHGTVVVCLGNTGREHTFLGKDGDGDIKGISAFLNRRFWDIPGDVEVYVQELRSSKRTEWPRSFGEASRGPAPASGTDRRWNRRRILGAQHYVENVTSTAGGHLSASDTVTLADGTAVFWYLWEGDRPAVHSYAHKGGFIAALYEGELYDIKTHPASFRRFGVSHASIRERLTLVVTAPKLASGFGVYPDTARSALKIKGTKLAGEPLPWDEWGDEFSRNMPEALRAAITAESAATSGTLDDPKWRERLADRFGARWRRIVLTLSPSGTLPADPDAPVAEPRGPTTTKPRPPTCRLSTTTSSSLTAGAVPGTTSIATETKSRGGLPTYSWRELSEDEARFAGVWSPNEPGHPEGVVILNPAFPAFAEVIAHWKGAYPEYMATDIERVVQEVYGEASVARIAHSEALTRDPRWGRAAVDSELRTPQALTMAILGLVSDEHVIAARLRTMLGARRTA